MSATIEEVTSDHSDHEHHEHHDHDHDHHGHAHHDHDHQDLSEANLDKIQSRAERKARKALLGMGLKRVPDINRVTLRRAKTVLLVVSQPDVYKSANSDCYIVFGEAKVEDTNQSGFASQLAQQNIVPQGAEEEDDDDVPALEPVADDGAPADDEVIDETGIDPKDIDMVMTQVGCDRKKAVAVLKENNGDLISAIMAATE